MKSVFQSVAAVLGLPALLAVVYFGFLASDVYVSEARFAVRSAEGGSVTPGLIAFLDTSGVAGGGQESQIVVDYAHSQDMLDRMQATLDLRAHYSADTIDVLSRLPDDATNEEFLEYFRDRTELLLDSASGVITLRARGFEPEFAQRVGELVIDLSEQLVNDMSARMEVDALATARDEVSRAAERVRAASTRLTAFRNTNDSLNPAAESSAVLGIVSGIETRLIETRTELNEKLAYMREDAPAIIALRNRLNALERERRLERGRLSGDEGQQLSGLIESYEPLALEQQIAQQQYTSALNSLELARLEAQRKKQYLVTFIEPALPDEAVEPRRLRRIVTVVLMSLLVYLIGGLMWSALKEHLGR